jgi:hypothetical protein
MFSGKKYVSAVRELFFVTSFIRPTQSASPKEGLELLLPAIGSSVGI